MAKPLAAGIGKTAAAAQQLHFHFHYGRFFSQPVLRSSSRVDADGRLVADDRLWPKPSPLAFGAFAAFKSLIFITLPLALLLVLCS
jgi:hypothetical protein